MQHLKVKAATTTTDKGEFSALAATYSIDRVGDRIVPGAFEKTIKAWRESQKNVPLHWDHSGSADDIIGHVDPLSMRETKDGLYVEGKLDLENSEVAREAWRSMKNNALALSFGYLATKQRKKGKVNELLEIDLFEISIVPAPANADTRVLSLKSALTEEIKAEEQEAKSETEGQFKDVEAVQAYLDQHFPGHKISKTSEGKSNPLIAEAWALMTPRASAPLPVPEVEPEPETLNSTEVTSEAWALALKPRST